MKRSPLWFCIIPVVFWPIFIYNVESIILIPEDKTVGSVILFASIISILFTSTILPPLAWVGWKQDQKRAKLREKIDRDTNPKYASILRWGGKTPAKGEYVVCLDKDNWVIIQWNKEPGCSPWMAIFTPPNHENRTNLIARQWYNGQMEEVQKVKVEDLPRIS